MLRTNTSITDTANIRKTDNRTGFWRRHKREGKALANNKPISISKCFGKEGISKEARRATDDRPRKEATNLTMITILELHYIFKVMIEKNNFEDPKLALIRLLKSQGCCECS